MTIENCKARCVNSGHRARKSGEVCGDPATHEHNGRKCCWLHYEVLASGSRTIEFAQLPLTPLRMVAQ